MTQPQSDTVRQFSVRVIRNEGEYEVEVLLYEEIGAFGLSAKTLAEELKRHKNADRIYLRINSPGGDTSDGFAMFNALKRHKAEIVVDIDGIALSAASVVAMAGTRIRMASNAILMVHEPWTIAMGNADQMRQTAEVLDKYNDNIAQTYADRSGMDKKAALAMMAEETWLTAQEALEAGLVDEITGEKTIAAFGDMSKYRRVPAALSQRLAAPAARAPAGTTAADGSAAPHEENEMSDKDKIEGQAPDATAAVEAAKVEAAETARKAERARIASITLALAGCRFDAVRQKAIDDGLDLQAAKAAAFDAVATVLAESDQKMTEMQKRLDAFAASGVKVIDQAAGDDQEKAEAQRAADKAAADKAAAFQAKLDAAVKAGESKARAFSRLSAEDAEGHAAWVMAQQG